MANSYKDIIITPNRANTADPKIEFRGANSSVNTAIIVQTYPTSNGTVSFEGSAGQLFSITNDLTGSIFSVNDVSGIPSIEVFANGQINMAQYGGGVSIWGNTGIGTSSPYGIFQIENPTANNAAYKSILTITAHENTEGSTDGYNGTSASFGTTFRRNWNGGSYTDLAGIYAYAQNSWRGGLVFRTKSETSSGGSPADRMVITPAGSVGIGTNTPANPLTVQSNINQIRLNTSSDPSGYYTTIGAQYNYGEAFAINVAGGAGLKTIMTYSDAAGLTLASVSASPIVLSTNGTTRLTVSSAGSVTASLDMRAPIFYDSDDTGYYINPNATETSMRARGMLDLGPNTGWGRYLRVGGNPGDVTEATIAASNGNLHIDAKTGFTTYMNYYSSSGTIFGGRIDAPIYYDSGDTSYYLDPGSISYLNDIRPNIMYDRQDTNYYIDMNGVSRVWLMSLYVGNENVGGANASNEGLVLRGNYNSNTWAHKFHKYDNGSGVPMYLSQSLGTAAWNPLQGWGTGLSYTSQVFGSLASDQLYSQIFYDTNNTGYYVNPASNSNIYSFGVAATSNFFGGYAGASGMAIEDQSTFTRIAFHDLDFYDWQAGSIFRLQNFASSATSMRAPIFYDSDNTAYYVDPSASGAAIVVNGYMLGGLGAASTSGTLDWNDSTNSRSGSTPTLLLGTATNGPGGSSYYHPLNFEYASKNGSGSITQLAIAYGSSANKLWMRGKYDGSWTGWIEFLHSGGDTQTKSGSLISNTDLRAPLFYDSNNTAYFVDPNSTSRMATVNADTLRSYTDIYTDQNHGYGLVGVYSAVRYQGVFAMGNSYKLPADGTTTGNLYGIAWSHPNAGGIAGNLNTHGALFLENGAFMAAISGSIRCRDDMRAPIYYDSGNTSYYVDPAGTSQFLSAYFIGGIGGISNSSSYTEAALEIRERTFGGAQDDTWATAPRIGFHWGGRVAAQIALSSSGTITILNDPGNATSGFECGNSRANSLGVGTAASGTAGEIRATNNITAYYSDRRLKENITPIENPIAKLMAISGVTFNSNDTAAGYGYTDKKRQIGVIAQEVAAVLPEIVVSAPFDIGQNKDGTEYSISGENYQTVQYEKLVPLLIEAVKAQQTLINSLQEQINALTEDR